ncbi:glycosyltransferase [Candidatus Microgenomates bacterium]|nr:glycosyltransferase [Candidatus Microgenomates bacterium]
MKVALVYDRVNKWGGAERVLLALHEIFPDAPLYTSVYNPRSAPWADVFPKIYTSFLQGHTLRSWRVHHEWLALLMPIAFEQFDFDRYDLVISVTSEAAKGIITKPGTKHICYCLTPTRYLWSGYEIYFGNKWIKWITQPLVNYLKNWDKTAAQRPDVMVGISKTVRNRISKYYGRDSAVIYPPVELVRTRGPAPGFPPRTPTRGPLLGGPPTRVTPRTVYFLLVSRLVSYKKIDLAIEAFNELDIPLLIVGTGSAEESLFNMARPNIHFLGQLTDAELASYYENAQALIFPQEEDFGIVAVEAQKFGCPVIAYHAGGALEIVRLGRTGEFFLSQTPEALISAITNFDRSRYDPKVIKNNAKRFSKEKFKKKFIALLKI